MDVRLRRRILPFSATRADIRTVLLWKLRQVVRRRCELTGIRLAASAVPLGEQCPASYAAQMSLTPQLTLRAWIIHSLEALGGSASRAAALNADPQEHLRARTVVATGRGVLVRWLISKDSAPRRSFLLSRTRGSLVDRYRGLRDPHLR
jgi:hypothetical protein